MKPRISKKMVIHLDTSYFLWPNLYQLLFLFQKKFLLAFTFSTHIITLPEIQNLEKFPFIKISLRFFLNYGCEKFLNSKNDFNEQITVPEKCLNCPKIQRRKSPPFVDSRLHEFKRL